MKTTMKITKKLVLAAILLSLAVSLPSLFPNSMTFGRMFQPMHTPVLLAGFIVGGPMAMVIGAAAPILRHLAVGLPTMETAIPMCFELATYGLVTGLVYKVSQHRGRSIVKRLLAGMLAGRIIWGIASNHLYNYTVSQIVTEVFLKPIPGIVIQLFLVPLIIYGLKKINKIK